MVAQLEEEKKHLEFMKTVKVYDQDLNDDNASEHSRNEKPDPVVDLFADDDNDERNRKFHFLYRRLLDESLDTVYILCNLRCSLLQSWLKIYLMIQTGCAKFKY